MVTSQELNDAYNAVKTACRNDWRSQGAGQAIIDLAVIALDFLVEECEQVGLRSSVPGKEYVSYSRNGIVARPVNSKLFAPDSKLLTQAWQLMSNENPDMHELERVLYTMALAPCLAMELLNRNNKKAPATYFECMIGHIFAKSLNSKPAKGTRLPIMENSVRMTMDFLFETSAGNPNIHLPVKMSTRERVVQAWAHQHLLDSAYGNGYYTGIMVLFSETKLDAKKLEVVEICVPDQWLAYQSLLSKMERIYYFDLPARYQQLTDDFPDVIQIRPFTEYFTTASSVVDQQF